jgi:dsDNA-specific endonuclease/ATPase MutS2
MTSSTIEYIRGLFPEKNEQAYAQIAADIDDLARRISELQELRRKDALEIARLQGLLDRAMRVSEEAINMCVDLLNK